MSRSALAALVLTSAVLLAGCVSRSGPPAEKSHPPSPTVEPGGSTSSTTNVDGCQYTTKPDEPAPVGLPPSGNDVIDTVTLTTNRGDLTITLQPDQAPCTVHSFVHLAGSGFYDGTKCHRMTTVEGLKILQCGDPKGDGTGGPGYTIPDEYPTDLTPTNRGDSTVTYPRGTVAMANAGPGTGGSQFFIVWDDSSLPPNYTVFGTVDDAGLAVLQSVAAGGVAPGGNAPNDGPPVLPVEVRSAATS